MTTNSVDYEILSGYLQANGWQTQRSSEVASLWSLRTQTVDQELAVPLAVRLGSFEWSDIVRRIAVAEGRPERLVEQDFMYAGYDSIRFRIANDGFIGETVPLHSGVTLVSSAYSMLRASATTAQRLRGQIGGNYSKTGDEYVERARLGHTEEGSFIVPILFQHDEAVVPRNIEPLAGTEAIPRESPQRRIVRTLAQTLDTYKRRIIEPAKQVRKGDLTPVIAAGGSKELFASLEKILYDPAVAEFETRFTWATNSPVAEDVPSAVSIPADAREIVKQTVEVLTQTQRQPTRIFTGPIVAYERNPDDPLFRIALQTPNANGRLSWVYMMLRAEKRNDILHWIEQGLTVTVQGIIERAPGRPLQLQGISDPTPLDDTFLTTSQAEGAVPDITA